MSKLTTFEFENKEDMLAFLSEHEFSQACMVCTDSYSLSVLNDDSIDREEE